MSTNTQGIWLPWRWEWRWFSKRWFTHPSTTWHSHMPKEGLWNCASIFSKWFVLYRFFPNI